MTAHEWMMRYRYAEGKVRRANEEIRRCREAATGVSPARGGGGGRGGDTTSKVERFAIRMADIEETIREETEEKERTKREIRQVIAKLQNETARTLMGGYYLRGQSWEEAAQECGISKQWAIILKTQALSDIGQILQHD